jgi:hypothetical protein
MTSETERDKRLSTCERTMIALAGVVALAIAMALTFYPTSRVKEERDGKNLVVKSSVEQTDQKELSLLLTASSLIMFFWALNGLRLSKLTVGSVSAETKVDAVKVAEKYAKADQAPTDVTVPTPPPEDIKEPSNPVEVGSVVIHNELEAVYSLANTPRYVLEDLFKIWPVALPKPNDYSTFEFATRKKGKGNHPWTVKFADLPAFRISYGGQGKEAATVSVQ